MWREDGHSELETPEGSSATPEPAPPTPGEAGLERHICYRQGWLTHKGNTHKESKRGTSGEDSALPMQGARFDPSSGN